MNTIEFCANVLNKHSSPRLLMLSPKHIHISVGEFLKLYFKAIAVLNCLSIDNKRKEASSHLCLSCDNILRISPSEIYFYSQYSKVFQTSQRKTANYGINNWRDMCID
ncbi:unnamed protein product [Moneuplotes crassus]|uniref:Uncharacterized protein n=1 Tax=Euplotes crassus TaxID=5936 RepID=A0AAD1URF4_EUPCR|nr:unnamed protein product [Moneuplotes crassus]